MEIAEILRELQQEQEELKKAIRSLESLIRNTQLRRHRSRKTTIDYAIDVLSATPEMHVDDLTTKVSQLAGYQFSRASIDGVISREIRNQQYKSRFQRVRPGYYALNKKSA
jgi:acetyl-CoA carboxylase alpha subunit